jgi:hypothetical protein
VDILINYKTDDSKRQLENRQKNLEKEVPGEENGELRRVGVGAVVHHSLLYVCMYICICTCMCVCVCVCVCVYVYIYVCVYI